MDVIAAFIAAIIAFFVGAPEMPMQPVVPMQAPPVVSVQKTETPTPVPPKTVPKKKNTVVPEKKAKTEEADAADAEPNVSTPVKTDVPSSVPATFTSLNNSTHVLANGNATLYRFKVTAGTVAERVEDFTLQLSRYGGVRVADIRIFVFSDEAFSHPVSGYPDGKVYASSVIYDSPSGLVHTSEIEAAFSSPLLVPAGESRYFLVLGEIREVVDHPDYVTATILKAPGLSGSASVWWLTYNGLPKSETGGYNLEQGASAAAAFEAAYAALRTFLSWFGF